MEGENVCEKNSFTFKSLNFKRGNRNLNDETYRKHIRTDAYDKITKIKLIFNIN